MCCYRDVKNFERFNLIIQSVICLCVCQLKNIKSILSASSVKLSSSSNSSNNQINNTINQNSNNNEDNASTAPLQQQLQLQSTPDKNSQKSEDQVDTPSSPNATSESLTSKAIASETKKEEEKYSLHDIEKLLILVSKAFLLNFPLYVAYKHGVQARWDEISAQEAQSFGLFCDFHDTEVPAYLFRNVSLFCNSGGFSIMSQCFEQTNFPVSIAHAITAVISNLKIWLNYRSTVQLFVPIRIKVLQYMCKLSDQELRSPTTRSMAGKLTLFFFYRNRKILIIFFVCFRFHVGGG